MVDLKPNNPILRPSNGLTRLASEILFSSLLRGLQCPHLFNHILPELPPHSFV